MERVARVARAALGGAALLVAVGAAAVAPGPATAQGTTDPAAALARLLDEAAVRRLADTLDHAVDTKDWALARAQFADRLRLDVSSLGGGPPSEVAADDLVAGWRRAFAGGKTALHLRTNHLVRFEEGGARAVMTSHGYAWNRLPADALPGQPEPLLWEVWGTYEHRAERAGPSGAWRITGFAFNATHERGDRRVLTTALPE